MASPSPQSSSWFPDPVQLRSVGRSIMLAAAVGIIAGISAVVLQYLTQWVMHLALVEWVGYDQGGGHFEETFVHHGLSKNLRPVMLLLVPTLGGLIVGWIIYKWAPEAEGGGADAAMDAFHNKRGRIRLRVPIIKMFTSAITLGTGGSGGREGPIAQIGAGFGSYLGEKFGLSDAERRILMTAGIGAGIGALFHAPLAGAIFAVEVLYRDPDFEYESLIPSFIATTFAYCIFNIITGLLGADEAVYQPLFAVAGDIEFRNPLLLLPLTVLAGVMVISSFAFSRIFHRTTWIFKRMALRNWLKPAVGASWCGLMALILWASLRTISEEASHDGLSVLSMGYGYLQKILQLNGEMPVGGLGTALLILMAVAFGKMITTAMTIGSGGPGGVFGPSMVIGGALGAAVGLLFREIMPGVVERIDVFVILGMAAFFAAAANTPLSTLIMVTELTASYELLLPAMWVCALSYLVSRGWSIFNNQVDARQNSAAHRSEFMIDVLQGMQIKDVISPVHSQFITVLPGMRLKDVVHLFTDTKQNCFPVVDRRGKYYGLFSLSDIRQFLHASELAEVAVAHDLAIKTHTLRTDMDLNAAVERFAARPFEELPVTDASDPNHIVAMLRREDLIAAYNSKLIEIRKETADKVPAP